MEITAVKDVQKKSLIDFFRRNDQIEMFPSHDSGYVCRVNEEIIGCFSLQKLDQHTFWLDQLYINEDAIEQLPQALTAILKQAKEMEAKVIYAHSMQLVTDLLLCSLHFSLQADMPQLQKIDVSYTTGRWWSYHVS